MDPKFSISQNNSNMRFYEKTSDDKFIQPYKPEKSKMFMNHEHDGSNEHFTHLMKECFKAAGTIVSTKISRVFTLQSSGEEHEKCYFDKMKIDEKFYFDRSAIIEEKLEKDKVKIDWIGHATLLFTYSPLENETTTILIDPSFCQTIAARVYKRMSKPGIPLEELPKIDIILNTHGHEDHLDLNSVKKIYKRDHPIGFFPDKTGTRIRKKMGMETEDCKWGDTITFKNGLTLTFVPAQHSFQTGLLDFQQELWGGWVLKFPNGFTAYVPGDTACHLNDTREGYNKAHYEFNREMFSSIAKLCPELDLVCVGISPAANDERVHANHSQILDMLELLKPKFHMPYHYGAWPFLYCSWSKKGDLDGLLENFSKVVSGELKEGEALVLKIGEQVIFYKEEKETVIKRF